MSILKHSQLFKIRSAIHLLTQKSSTENNQYRPHKYDKIVGKRCTVYVEPGQTVRKGFTMVKQLSLSFHPGLNVGIGKDRSLYAEVDGRVVISCEKLNPKWDNKWVQFIYGENHAPSIYKKFYHIIPEPQENKFHLVDLI